MGIEEPLPASGEEELRLAGQQAFGEESLELVACVRPRLTVLAWRETPKRWVLLTMGFSDLSCALYPGEVSGRMMKPFRITQGGIGCFEPKLDDRAMTMAIPENGSGHFDEIPVKPPRYEAVTLREPENGLPRFDTLPSESAPGLLPFFGPQRNPDANPTPYAVTLMDPENGNPRFDTLPRVGIEPRPSWLDEQERIVDVDPRTWLQKQERIVGIDPRPRPDKHEPSWRRGLLEKLERARAEQRQDEIALPIMKRGANAITD